MQNRESAIRSRTRKKSHVDTIETILSDINSKNKYLSCENDALNNENAFLKKRLSYFEELFKVKAEKEKTNE
jgi:regulator of replication initiation timing